METNEINDDGAWDISNSDNGAWDRANSDDGAWDIENSGNRAFWNFVSNVSNGNYWCSTTTVPCDPI